MKKSAFLLLSAMCLSSAFAGCTGGGQEQATSDEGSVDVGEEQVDSEPSEPAASEFEGTVVDEMMSTITLATEEGDTVTYVKGEAFSSDAAIGDKVLVSIDVENDEQAVVCVKRI